MLATFLNGLKSIKVEIIPCFSLKLNYLASAAKVDGLNALKVSRCQLPKETA